MVGGLEMHLDQIAVEPMAATGIEQASQLMVDKIPYVERITGQVIRRRSRQVTAVPNLLALAR